MAGKGVRQFESRPPHGTGILRRWAGLACGLLLLVAYAAAVRPASAGEWLGWRGLDREGHSESPVGPLEWSADRNIAWKVQVPGEGLSSPVVSGDAIFLTTSYMSQRDVLIKLATNLAMFGCLLVLMPSLMRFFIASCGSLRGGVAGVPQFLGLTGFALFAALVAAVVLLGESSFDFERCEIRRWIATGVVLSSCIILSGLYLPAGSRLRLWVGVGAVLFGVFAAVGVPAPSHAYRGGVLSGNTAVMLVFVGWPVVAGVLLTCLYLKDRALGLGSARLRRVVRLLQGVALGAGAVAAALLVRGVTIGNLAIGININIPGYYEPALEWWVLAAAAGLCAAALALRLALGNRFAANVVAQVGTFLFLAVLIAMALEQVFAHSRYLTYHFGTPAPDPKVGWPAVIALGASGVLLLVGLAVRQALRGAAIAPWRLSTYARVVFLVMGVGYFAAANTLSPEYLFVRGVVCLDRATGRVRWVCEGITDTRGQLHKDNSAATPTPAVDGSRVYAYFGTPGLLCTDRAGKTLWLCRDLPFETVYGPATSPVLCGGKVIIASDSLIGGYVAALDCETGQTVWKTPRKKRETVCGTNRTPLVKRVGGRTVILVWGESDVTAYDPASGQEVWTCAVPYFGGDDVASLASDDTRFYLGGPRRVMALDIKKFCSGENPVVWDKDDFQGPNVSTPVIAKGMLFMATDTGRIQCLDCRDGAVLWRERFKGLLYASPVVVGEHVYFSNDRGRTIVVAAESQFRKVAESDLGEKIFASPAPVDGLLYVRAGPYLYCLRGP